MRTDARNVYLREREKNVLILDFSEFNLNLAIFLKTILSRPNLEKTTAITNTVNARKNTPVCSAPNFLANNILNKKTIAAPVTFKNKAIRDCLYK